jgi:hypothetical protein
MTLDITAASLFWQLVGVSGAIRRRHLLLIFSNYADLATLLGLQYKDRFRYAAFTEQLVVGRSAYELKLLKEISE